MISIEQRKLVLRWHNEGKNQQEIADLVGCHQTSICRLINKFNKRGNIKNLPRSGRPTKLKGSFLKDIKNKLLKKINSANDEYNHISTKQIKRFIAKEVGREYSIRHIERLMHKLGFSLITPRPQHLRHDQKKVDNFREEFKKNLNQNIWIMKS